MIEVVLRPCPTCGEETTALGRSAKGDLFCPACAPLPEKTPHDYQRLLTGSEVVAIQQRVAGS